MGTQFSKIKVTQRVEVHGQVIHDYYAINQNGGYYQTGSDLMMESNYNHSNYSNQIMDRNDINRKMTSNSAVDLNDLYTRRAHHSGVLSGHELLSYSFLGGQACEPRRSIRRKHRSRSSMSLPRSTTASAKSSTASSYYGIMGMHPSSVNGVGGGLSGTINGTNWKKSTIKYLTNPWMVAKEKLQNSTSHLNFNLKNKSGDAADHPDSELDSGISVNGNYDQIEPSNRNGGQIRNFNGLQNYERIEELHGEPYARHLMNRVQPPPPTPKKNLWTTTAALKAYYRENFSDWFEPITGRETMARRSSRKKKLHQKLVMSKMNAKKAAKLDMDDRAKILQYFSRPVGAAGDIAGAVESVKIEEMFGKCWCLPGAAPPLPTIITVQAPAGIGKSSMLKYMCMKWGCHELWTDNFDIMLFVECRTLNRLGSMTGEEFLKKILEPSTKKVGTEVPYGMMSTLKRYMNHDPYAPQGSGTSYLNDGTFSESPKEEEETVLEEITRKASIGRVLILLDGLDEVHAVGNLSNICQPAGHPEKPGIPGKGALTTEVTPLQFTQCLLSGSLLPGCHIVVTSRPHTLSHLQSSRWFLSLPKRMVSLDIQGLSEEGVESFIHSYVDARQFSDNDSRLYAVTNGKYEIDERQCSESCACQKLQDRARNDPYIFSLAPNPFYLWLICTIYTEAGEDFVPKTLTQLYTWVMLVFANRWQNTSLQLTTSLIPSTVSFMLGFSRLCYYLVKTGNIKISAVLSTNLDTGVNTLSFPELGDVTIDMDKAETFGLMTVGQDGSRLECEFRHLSLAEYMTALHIHINGDSLKGFPKDRKELILQYLSGLASRSQSSDQMVVKEFLSCLGSSNDTTDALDYLKSIQKMKGEWYNQQGLQKQMLFMRCAFESRQEKLALYPFPGLKIINIRGSALLALDLIIIGSFVSRLADQHRLLELALRDYPLDMRGLVGLLPCIPLVRTVTICLRRLTDPKCYYMLAKAVEQSKSRLRELYLLELPPCECGLLQEDGGPPPDELGKAVNHLRETCRVNAIRISGVPIPTIIYD